MRAAPNAGPASGWAALLLAVLIAMPAKAQSPVPESEASRPAVATYSIVAVDEHTGEIAAAVLSHWFSVGSLVTWAEAGVGAVATQGFLDPDYGPRGLEAMRKGASADKALQRLLKRDDKANIRQVAFVDANSEVASHTGENTMGRACQAEGWGYSVQANGVEPGILNDETVCGAMAAHFQYGKGDLATRMIAALEAGAKENGESDEAQRRSAAIIVVGKERGEEPWRGRLIDLRVEDRTGALAELKRLVTTNTALNLMREGDAYLASEKIERANAAYNAAFELAPDHDEIVFWRAVSLANAGHVDAALPFFARAFAASPAWRRAVEKRPDSVLLPDDPALIKRILAVTPERAAEPAQ